MAKENNKKLIIWALVALVIGVIIGLVITNLTTTGKGGYISEIHQIRPKTQVGITMPIPIYLELVQEIDSVNGGTGTINKYAFIENEEFHSNLPGKVRKNTTVNFSDGTVLSDDYTSELEYSAYYSEYIAGTFFGPFTSIEATIYDMKVTSIIDAHFKIGSKIIPKSLTTVFNPNEDLFAVVNSLDLDCSGQYNLTHSEVGDIDEISGNLYISQYNQGTGWTNVLQDYPLDLTSSADNTYTGYIPASAITQLNNGSQYIRVSINSHIITATGLQTSAEMHKYLNCQTNKSESLTPEEIKDVRKITGYKSIDERAKIK
ncbi:MAG: hypothetical protein WCX82_01425 [archaeon]|jgi:hypothetical protein